MHDPFSLERPATVSYNLWGRKNPFLSMWLSGANAMVGATRNQVTAAMHRQATAAMTAGTKQMLALWGLGSTPQRQAKRRRVTRRAR